MKTKVFLILTLVLALLIVSCDNESQPTIVGSSNVESSNLEKGNAWQLALDALVHKFTSSMEAGDIDGFMECIWNSPDFVFVSQNGEITRGYNNMKVIAEGIINATEWRTLKVKQISSFKAGDAVYSVGIATWDYKLKNGPEITFDEVWTDVAKRVHGKFVYLVDHTHDLTPFTP